MITQEELMKYRKRQLSVGKFLGVVFFAFLIFYDGTAVVDGIKHLDFSFSLLFLAILLLGFCAIFIMFLVCIYEGLYIQKYLGSVHGIITEMSTSLKGKNGTSYDITIKVDRTYIYDFESQRFKEKDLELFKGNEYYLEIDSEQYESLSLSNKVECLLGVKSQTVFDIKVV